MSLNNVEYYSISPEEIQILTDSLFSEEFPNLIEELIDAKYSISDLKITPRDATYWDKQGILPTVKGSGTRRKYDLTQSVWIKLIQQMRSLGISLKKIKNLNENLLEPKNDITLMDQALLVKIIDQLKAKYDNAITHEQLVNQLKVNQPNLFMTTVLSTIIFRKSMKCIVNMDGEYHVIDASRYAELFKLDKDFQEFVSKPHFSISITRAIQTLISDWVPDKPTSKLQFLSNTEIQILEMLRRNDVDSILIRFANGEPFLLEIEEQSTIRMEQRFLDVIAKNGYQKISVTTQNGKITNFENVILKKLNNSTK